MVLLIVVASGAVYGVLESSPPDVIDTIDEPPSVVTTAEVTEDDAVLPVTVTETESIEPIEATFERRNETATSTPSVLTVPFYSQFADISDPSWKKIGCGIAGLAMLIEHHNPGKVKVDTLLQEGIAANAYLSNAGWTYAGLIGISKKYGLTGASYDLGGSSMETAFGRLKIALKEGPVMVSVHYTFDPKNPIPHLVIANGVRDGMLYYNDPAEKSGGGSVSVAQFQSAWKKRYIEFYPAT